MSKIKAIVYVEEEALEQLKKGRRVGYATDRDTAGISKKDVQEAVRAAFKVSVSAR